MSAGDHFAIRARVALCERWPELCAYNQSDLLRVLTEAYTRTEDWLGRAPNKRKKGEADIPPKPEDVTEYFKSIGYEIDGHEFCDHYKAKGWKIGSNLMKDWQSAARTWKRSGWGHLLRSPFSPAIRLTEWERQRKTDRIGALRTELRDLTHPGGCAYAVELTPEKREKGQKILDAINVVRRELGE